MNLITWDRSLKRIPTSTGLEVDALIFKKALTEGTPQIKVIFQPNFVEAGRQYIDIKTKTKLIRIHLEHIRSHNLLSKNNWFMVNQELVEEQDLENMKFVELVITKTKYAFKLLNDLKKTRKMKFRVFYLGFTSIAKGSTKKNYSKWFHGAGASWMKNTKAIIKAWLKHPEYPHLIITCRLYCAKDNLDIIELAKNAKNITIYTETLPVSTLNKIISESGVQIISSQTEGWGHYIQEAKSAGALCVYSNFPPMNEFFTNKSGVSVNNGKKVKTFALPGAYGINYTENHIEKAVNKVLKLSEIQKKHMGEAAKKSFYEDRKRFLLNIKKLKNIILN